MKARFFFFDRNSTLKRDSNQGKLNFFFNIHSGDEVDQTQQRNQSLIWVPCRSKDEDVTPNLRNLAPAGLMAAGAANITYRRYYCRVNEAYILCYSLEEDLSIGTDCFQ